MATKKKVAANNGWKICSRGHKYRGSGPCPKCWPGGRAWRKAGEKGTVTQFRV
jgi:hypothetical protein